MLQATNSVYIEHIHIKSIAGYSLTVLIENHSKIHYHPCNFDILLVIIRFLFMIWFRVLTQRLLIMQLFVIEAHERSFLQLEAATTS